MCDPLIITVCVVTSISTYLIVSEIAPKVVQKLKKNKMCRNISDFLHKRSKCHSLLRKMTEDNGHHIKEKHMQKLSEMPSDYSLEIINLLEKAICSKKKFKEVKSILILTYLLKNSQAFVEKNHHVQIKKIVETHLQTNPCDNFHYKSFKLVENLRKELDLPPCELQLERTRA